MDIRNRQINKLQTSNFKLQTGLQPLFPTVPYLETGGSIGSLFGNCLQPHVPMVPNLETDGSNGPLYGNRLQPPFHWFLI